MEDIFAELRELSAEQRELMIRMLEKEGIDLTRLPVPQRLRPDRAPMSATQQRLWALHELSKGLPTENVPVAIELAGSLNVDALSASIAYLIERHAILRTTFHGDAEVPEQRIHVAREFSLPIVELSALGGVDDDTAVSAALVAEASKLFALETDWLMRPALFRLAEEKHILLLTFHQLVVDGWAVNLLAGELGVAYSSIVTGKQPDLEPLPVQYADLAEWEQDGWEDNLIAAQLDYWVAKLTDAPPLLSIPTGRTRPAAPSFTGALRLVEFDAETIGDLRGIARDAGVTMFTAVLATLKVLLRAYSGQQDVVVGTLTSRRGKVEAENMVGNFGNNLLLRSVLADTASFRDVLQTVNDTTLDAMAHQDASLDAINTALHARNRQRIPAFQIGFIFRDGGLHDRLKLPELEVRQRFVDLRTARLDLWFDLADHGTSLSGEIMFRDDLFDHRQIDLLVGHWAEAIRQLTSFPDLPLSEIDSFKGVDGMSPTRASAIAALLRQHPAVEDARVVTPGPLVGGAATIEFVRAGSDQVTGTELREWLNAELGAPVGPAIFSETEVLNDASPAAARATAALPESDLERQVAAVWSAALGIQTIYVHDNFFDLGGHSLLAVQVLKSLRGLGSNSPDPKSLVTGTLRQLAVQMSADNQAHAAELEDNAPAMAAKRGLLGKWVARLS